MAETNTARRRRSSSILQVYHEPPETVEQLSDRAALPNGNANWVNAKGKAHQKERKSSAVRSNIEFLRHFTLSSAGTQG